VHLTLHFTLAAFLNLTPSPQPLCRRLGGRQGKYSPAGREGGWPECEHFRASSLFFLPCRFEKQLVGFLERWVERTKSDKTCRASNNLRARQMSNNELDDITFSPCGRYLRGNRVLGETIPIILPVDKVISAHDRPMAEQLHVMSLHLSPRKLTSCLTQVSRRSSSAAVCGDSDRPCSWHLAASEVKITRMASIRLLFRHSRTSSGMMTSVQLGM